MQLSSVRLGCKYFFTDLNHHSRQQSQHKEHRVEVPLFPHTSASLRRLYPVRDSCVRIAPRKIVIYSQLPFNTFSYWHMIIAGHRHQGRCLWHRHSGISKLSPVPEHSGTGLGFLITAPGLLRHREFPVPDWVSLFRYRAYSGIGSFFSFRYQNGQMPKSPAFRHKLYECGKRNTLPCTSTQMAVWR